MGGPAFFGMNRTYSLSKMVPKYGKRVAKRRSGKWPRRWRKEARQYLDQHDRWSSPDGAGWEK